MTTKGGNAGMLLSIAARAVAVEITDATEACRIGLVNRVIPGERLLLEVAQVA